MGRSYTLPVLEFDAAIAAAEEPSPRRRVAAFTPILPDVAYGIEAAGPDMMETWARAARRSILTYGLFEAMGSGPDAPSVVAQAAVAAAAGPAEGASWRVGAVALAGSDGGDSDAKRRLEELRLLLVSRMGLEPAWEASNERVTPDMDLVLFVLPSSQLLLCRRLAKGPAVGKGYTYAESPRRPRAGVLKVLAQHRLRTQAVQTSTAMEPELGLLMATMACVGRGSRVLDPFVGGGSILLAAALLGAGEVVGTDAAAELVEEGSPVRAAAMEAFATLANPDGPVRRALLAGEDRETVRVEPTLRVADIREYLNDEYADLFRRDYYDAIVTDPPYSIKERVRGGGGGGSAPPSATEREDVLAIIRQLLDLGAHTLAPGGRLVFFLPAWGLHGLDTSGVGGRKGPSAVQPLAAPVSSVPIPLVSTSDLWGRWNARVCKEDSAMFNILPSLSLRLIGAQPQVFTPTFVRWLVCVEKER